MKKRSFGKTGFAISEISLGTWQLGSVWGEPFDQDVAMQTLKNATAADINAFDTADVYQDGKSEETIGTYIKTLSDKPFIITKTGRRLPAQTKEGYNEGNIRSFIDDSRKRLNQETLDMVLLHCPPTDVYYNPEVFKLLDTLKTEGKIKHYGVSVERIEEGLKALEYEGVDAVEIIFNMFRMRPAEVFFEQAKLKNVGVIVRVPLASGLLTGKFNEKTTFNKNDHRTYNRDGAAFDKGETFSGVDYNLGLKAVDALKKHFNTDNIAPYALRWILMFDAVSTVIPGASKPEHIRNNAKAATMEPLSDKDMAKVREIYDTFIKDPVHHLW